MCVGGRATCGRHYFERRVEDIILTLESWSRSMGRAHGIVTHAELAQLQRFRQQSEHLLNCVRFSRLLKGGASSIRNAVSKAIKCAVPIFIVKSLSLDDDDTGVIPSATTVRRGQCCLDWAISLQRSSLLFSLV